MTIETPITVEQLIETFQVDKGTALLAMAILGDHVSQEFLEDHFPSVRQLYNWDGSYAIKLALNDLLSCFGVEDICHPFDRDDHLAEYLNTGDAYSATIIFPVRGTPYISTWGDVYEGAEREACEEILASGYQIDDVATVLALEIETTEDNEDAFNEIKANADKDCVYYYTNTTDCWSEVRGPFEDVSEAFKQIYLEHYC